MQASLLRLSHTQKRKQIFKSQKRKNTSQLSLTKSIELIKKGELKSSNLIESCYQNIEEKNEYLNAFVYVSDINDLNVSSDGLLNGVPIGIKDNFNVEGLPTTCASDILESYVSPYNATVCQKIIDESGCIIGKTNLDEFGMGSFNKFSKFGPALSPLFDPSEKRVAGGSSGGSAAAVASFMCSAALGSDTGGSVRLPAAWCGIVGFKPSYGLCSRFGLVAFASSLDTPSIMTRTVEDAAMMLDVISGHDMNDSTSISTKSVDYFKSLDQLDDLTGINIGIPEEFYIEELDQQVLQSWEEGIKRMEEKGAKIHKVNLPHTEYALSTYYIISSAEASSNLARYDGLRYGKRSETGTNVKDNYTASRDEGFGEEVKRRILLGTYVLQESAYNDYYRKALQVI
eukprot:TRINITY_DN4190_c0_g1_i2.p1 TRINITY_DN4190_c0_g1~~TRINITY_DN4190_c0_g1_i2.p1  ORF type:complete len:400 (+),score=98.95 TRINITY_DN4190_c0_g1_i2:6-1205(+)